MHPDPHPDSHPDPFQVHPPPSAPPAPAPAGRPAPDWLVEEPFRDEELGVLRSGKEAQIDLLLRRSTRDPDRTCHVARKRYLPRSVTTKGALEAMGVQQASTFRHDVRYREGRQFRKSRDRRAVERLSTYGKRLLQDRWTGHEHDVMSRLWQAGMTVPYPLAYRDTADGGELDLEYLGDADGAAPQLNAARLRDRELALAFDQLAAGLELLTRLGIAHGDLSAFNLLWWDETLWFIDFPQAVDIAANPQGLGFLHADVVNVCTWFARRGVDVDGEALFAELLVLL